MTMFADLDPCQHASGGNGEVEVAHHFRRGRSVDGCQSLLSHFVRVQQLHPVLGIHNRHRLLQARQTVIMLDINWCDSYKVAKVVQAKQTVIMLDIVQSGVTATM